MKRLKKWLAQEWEKGILYGVCALVVLFLAMCLLSFGTGESDVSARRKPPSYDSMLATHAFGFLSDVPVPESLPKDPFVFEKEVEQKAKTRRRPKVEEKPKPEPPKPKPVVRQEPPKKPPPPEPPKRRRPPKPAFGVLTVTYLYNTTNQSGKQFAFLQVTNPATRKTITRSFGIGDTINGIKIHSFNDQTLYLVDATGKRQKVRFGEQRRVVASR